MDTHTIVNDFLSFIIVQGQGQLVHLSAVHLTGLVQMILPNNGLLITESKKCELF